MKLTSFWFLFLVICTLGVAGSEDTIRIDYNDVIGKAVNDKGSNCWYGGEDLGSQRLNDLAVIMKRMARVGLLELVPFDPLQFNLNMNVSGSFGKTYDVDLSKVQFDGLSDYKISNLFLYSCKNHLPNRKIEFSATIPLVRGAGPIEAITSGQNQPLISANVRTSASNISIDGYIHLSLPYCTVTCKDSYFISRYNISLQIETLKILVNNVKIDNDSEVDYRDVSVPSEDPLGDEIAQKFVEAAVANINTFLYTITKESVDAFLFNEDIMIM